MIHQAKIQADGVHAFYTTRDGGESSGVFASLNFGDHVGDDPAKVAANRTRLQKAAGRQVVYMRQIHSAEVAVIEELPPEPPEADALVTRQADLALAVLTADCLPLLLAADDSSVIAAVHCGWRGLAAGIVGRAAAVMRSLGAARICAFTGPAIGPDSFEVREDLLEHFADLRGNAQVFRRAADETGAAGRWLCDLRGICNIRLREAGIEDVCACTDDTFALPGKYFSYRRDGQCGRMACLIMKA